MNGAAFFLVVNFAVAMSFSAVFLVVARRSQSPAAARWLGAGYSVASLSAICELLVAYAGPAHIWALGAFATVLCGMVMLTVGIGEMYRRRVDARIIALFVSASLFLAYVIYDLPRSTLLQALLYQAPFALVLLAGALIVFLARDRTIIDRFLSILLLTSGLQFFAKAGLAVLFGAGTTAKDYVHTNYALISQSLSAVLMVAIGLTLLAKLVLEIMAAQRMESEIDILSGLLNRRGFDRRVEGLFAVSRDGQHAIILCDLDHFKQINDTHGHHAGDAVIEAFGARVRLCVPDGAFAGRLGGEEFALFLPRTSVDVAVQIAQRLRLETMSLRDLPPSIAVTASFGVASVSSEAGLAEAYRQADQALYRAKNSGRNRVMIAASGYGT
ncbi:GGDEF domain-containing protein [Roseibium litorale]|uniref:diguanylate cyclase n=1 Tax=Roseibium litorale TaxID=2803841 RepID=A0ABR9CNX2_9HYPH|nr:GGDEF domain-containing protein [Roseibium litorale]MBD8892546.1 GGDEF domain-containing protein [Roseibium litorale]